MGTSSFLKENYFLLVTVGSTVLVVTIYHCIIISWRNRPRRANPLEEQDTTHKLADIQKNIPIHTYKTGKGSDDVECAVCLSEFEEGQELRTLPQCLHSFHVTCIDMWLCTHLSCPICRTNAVRLVPRGSATLPGQGGGASVMVTGTGSSSGLGSHGDGTRLESSVAHNLEVEHLPV